MQGAWNRRGIWLVAAVCFVGLTWPAGAGTVKKPTCELDGHVLRIDPGHFDMRIVRAGDTISARTSRGETDCGPVAPTVGVVDLVRIDSSEFTLDLDGGPFAPGFTDEGDGSSEIEFRFPVGLGALQLDLPDAAQDVRAGRLEERDYGVNLNADEAMPDVDLEMKGGRRIWEALFSLELRSGDGRDRIITSGGPGFAGPLKFFTQVSSRGGADLIRGGKGDDFVIPGKGRDVVTTNRGDDWVILRDRLRDLADCGAGPDFHFSDHRDRVLSCRKFDLAP